MKYRTAVLLCFLLVKHNYLLIAQKFSSIDLTSGNINSKAQQQSHYLLNTNQNTLRIVYNHSPLETSK